jgi:O-antigen/teichoic acid export membrane protein
VNIGNSVRSIINTIKNQQGVRKYSVNTFWLMVEKVFRMIIGLIVGIWVAKYLGPEIFGTYSYILSFTGIFLVVAKMGMDGVVVRELVRDESRRDVLLGTAFVIKLIAAVAIILIIFWIIQLKQNTFNYKLMILIVASSSVFQSLNVIDFFFQSKVLSKYVVYANIISLMIFTVVKVFLIISNAPLETFVVAILLESVVTAFGYLFIYRFNKYYINKWEYDSKVAKQLLNDSWPLIPHAVSFMVITNIDKIMIGEIVNNHAVGLYSMAHRIVALFYTFIALFTSSIFPALISDKGKRERRFVLLYRFVIILSISIVILYYSIGIMLVPMIFGAEYQESVNILNILIISIIFSSLSVASGKWFIVENYTKLFLFRSLSSAVLNIVLNYYLLKEYGVYGAAISTILTMFYLSYISNYFNKDTMANLKLIHQAIFITKRVIKND